VLLGFISIYQPTYISLETLQWVTNKFKDERKITGLLLHRVQNSSLYSVNNEKQHDFALLHYD